MSNAIVVEAIRNYFMADGTKCLFAGAGVGCRANLPTWSEYLEELAKIAEQYEPATALMMRTKAQEGSYLLAAHYYLICDKIPQGKRYKELGAPFEDSKSDPRQLTGLAALPFDCYATTNYDRSTHGAYSIVSADAALNRQVVPDHVELYDASMRTAPYSGRFYIARVHGRYEVPEDMVLDIDGYNRAYSSDHYLDFITHIFRDCRCLIVGFSFLDPGIDLVLRTLDKLRLPSARPLHTALLPKGTDNALIARLAAHNVESIMYEHSGNHDGLWDCINEVSKKFRVAHVRAPELSSSSHLAVHRLLASRYAGLKIQGKNKPLKQLALDTIVYTIIEEQPTGILTSGIIKEIPRYLSLPGSDLENVVRESLSRLLGECRVSQLTQETWIIATSSSKPDNNTRILRKGVEDRLYLFGNRKPAAPSIDLALDVLLDLLVSRGWDLGAHFAKRTPATQFDAWDQVNRCIERRVSSVNAISTDVLKHSIVDLLRRPDPDEGIALAAMGRLAFGLQLMLGSSNWAMNSALLLPSILYLDASFVLPLIVDGHPFSYVYKDTVAQLKRLARKAGRPIRLVVLQVFLNEVISHKKRADELTQLNGTKEDRFRDYIYITGATNTNVYVGGYSATLARKPNTTFKKYLLSAAPYSNEQELEQFLLQLGIEVEFNSPDAAENAVQLFHQLRNALDEENDAKALRGKQGHAKDDILLQHEAIQLAVLEENHRNGTKPLFVTADKLLLRHTSSHRIGPPGDCMISNTALVQLVDIFEGLSSGRESLGRLLLNAELSDPQAALRDLLIHKALESRDEAMSMNAYQVADRVAKESLAEADDDGESDFVASISTGREPSLALETFLERVEKRFFTNMAETVKNFKQKHKIED